jgi:hypothetical protein
MSEPAEADIEGLENEMERSREFWNAKNEAGELPESWERFKRLWETALFLCADWRNRHAPDKSPEGYPNHPHARCLCGCERQDHRASDDACPILPSEGPVLHFYEGRTWTPTKHHAPVDVTTSAEFDPQPQPLLRPVCECGYGKERHHAITLQCPLTGEYPAERFKDTIWNPVP